jgi:hypothetical protein
MRKAANLFGRHGRPKQAFFETEQGSPFHLDKKLLVEDVPEEMMEYMLSADNIRAVTRSRHDLNAYGNDGISSKIRKAADPEAVKFVQRIIKATMRCGRVFDSWKAASPILFSKKGNKKIRRTGGQSQLPTAPIEYTDA